MSTRKSAGKAATAVDTSSSATAFETESLEPVYSKKQLLAADRFKPQQKDVLNAILNDYETYSLGKVNRLMADFEQRTVE
ncbi:hypothetical protein [Cohnella thailandensis]|uniref:Uncharacterized protein n=1 Tax=Cohnella thailandensis TaxID=557557 RepID=A0A841STL7_9BACL|nr:hypothetical protein [Cohnella thailandensis]MBB6633558.1 hypothetical protein [Cohnella thailandensis]MBP1974575.1 hypothetical protein [Cohnella thailandensis]